MMLIIAEKPTAAKTIAEALSEDEVKEEGSKIKYWKIRFKGKDAIVFPLKGHIIDVDFPEEYNKWDLTTTKQLPDAKIEYKEKEKEIIAKLRELAKQATEVIIATDYDAEGESIGLEAMTIIKQENPNVSVKRALFSALTKKELQESFSNLNEVNINLAESANARREIDLIIGAALTRMLSIASNRLGNAFLSVGRVQTPTLYLISKREEEIENFKKEKYWIIGFKSKDIVLLYPKKLNEKEKNELVEKLKGGKLKITKVLTKRVSIEPPVPFNTTEFLRSCASIGISVPIAMRAAEDLYMKGFISYPRTDNQVYPPTLDLREIVNELRKGPYRSYIDRELGGELKPTKGKEAPDHPPIHPVKLASGVSPLELKVFDIIARRFLATLSKPSIEEKTKIEGEIKGLRFVAEGKVIISKGWKEIYPIKEEEVMLPKLSEGEELEGEIIVEEKETKPPARYSQAKIIKEMEKLGLGTKSTRPEILQKLFDRKYLSYGKTLYPSELGKKIAKLLAEHSKIVTSPELTKNLEENIESISRGKETKENVVNKARELTKALLDELENAMENIKKEVLEAIRKQKVVGKCPKCGGDLVIIVSKTSGKQFVGCSNYPACRYSLPLPQSAIVISPERCKYCEWHLIELQKGKRRIKVCINPDCPSKKNKNSD